MTLTSVFSGLSLYTCIWLTAATTRLDSDDLKKLQYTQCSIPVGGWVCLKIAYIFMCWLTLCHLKRYWKSVLKCTIISLNFRRGLQVYVVRFFSWCLFGCYIIVIVVYKTIQWYLKCKIKKRTHEKSKGIQETMRLRIQVNMI